jgi:hypothetical protein
MSQSDHAVFWTLPEALAWGQKRDPPDAFPDFLLTLYGLCCSGQVRAVGRRVEGAAKVLWSNREEVPRRVSVAPRPRDLSEPLPAREWEDLHFDSDGQKLRTEDLFSSSHGRRAWTHVQFSRDDLIREWPTAGAADFAADRFWADRDQKAMQRRKRERWRREWINRFVRRQQQARRWISFVEIADMCARAASPGSIAAEEEARALAYRRLVESMWRGEFETNGLSCVLLLLPDLVASVPPHRLTHDYLQGMVDEYGMTEFTSDSRLVKEQLLFCWLPRELCRQWFESHSLTWPDAFTPHEQTLIPQPESREEKLRKEIPEIPASVAVAPPKGRPGRKLGSGSFDDDKALREMLLLLGDNKAASVHAAAQAIVTAGKVKKTGTAASAARRLGQKFAARFGTEPPPGKTWSDVALELEP